MAQVKRARRVPVYRLDIRDLTVEARLRLCEQIKNHNSKLLLDTSRIKSFERRLRPHLRAAVAVRAPLDVHGSARRSTRKRRNVPKL